VDIGGVVKIKSVTSSAIATTTAAGGGNASGGTVVQGMTVAGQKVYLDERGLQVGEQGKPEQTNAVAAEAVNQALAGLGMKIYVSQPHGEQSGGTTTYNAGSVVLVWKPPSNPNQNVFVLTFGGANVSVAAGEGFGVPGGEEVPPVVGDVPPTEGGDGSVAVPSGTDAGSAPVSDLGGTGATATPGSGSGGSSGAASLDGTTNIADSFGGIGFGWILAGIAAAILIGVGSRRLMTDLLDRSAATCPLEVQR
jgi:hypothetical protein